MVNRRENFVGTFATPSSILTRRVSNDFGPEQITIASLLRRQRELQLSLQNISEQEEEFVDR